MYAKTISALLGATLALLAVLAYQNATILERSRESAENSKAILDTMRHYQFEVTK